ncbi:protein GLUTAMINE DUMPER 5-like isoform X2 [Vigna angularis]|uniref:protein GLUTAMINE DUMPER 5-like isoform X2 n=1 Tax=Phaseolus angularis TaxID=3914 RepID=UPI0022B3C9EE|nr:protein GLUTAMINE DUMPER 5-like isoform X2 [Vigna angularis]
MNETMANNETGRYEWWNSSASFLYGGLAPIFGVIGLALLVVVCSRCRRSDSEREAEMNLRRGVTATVAVAEIEEGPNILVIVAGENHPTHLAKPLPSTHNQIITGGGGGTS